YTATHTIANAAKHYYRLKMIDKDGSFTYSTVVILHSQTRGGVQLQVLGNPVQNQLNLSLQTSEYTKASLVLRNTVGSVVYQSQPLTLAAGTTNHTIATAQLPAGVYLVELLTSNGNKLEAKFIKQ
ncbi:MAG: T9SS C-terminal target domain-containing protein, partial [Bacteroidetes bacterium]